MNGIYQGGLNPDMFFPQWMVHKTKVVKEGHVSLLPVIEAIRKARYIYITKLLVWNIALEDSAVVSVVLILLFSQDAVSCLSFLLSYYLTRVNI